MSRFKEFSDVHEDWWVKLGLRAGVRQEGSTVGTLTTATLRTLRTVSPVAFVDDVSGEQLDLTDLQERLVAAELQFVREDAKRRATDAEAKRQFGWARIEEAYARPDSSDVIAAGEWAGFTRDRAFAWSWNLFDFEPQGGAHPKVEFLMRCIAQLTAGQLPEAFRYADRARTLEARGFDPREYRRIRELLQ